LYGGVGSGKSVFAIQKIIFRILTEQTTHRFLVVRKVGAKLKTSVFNEFLSVMKEWGIIQLAEVTTVPMSIKFPSLNNSEIIFSGIDESEKIKSISRITSIFVEEVTELSETDFDDIVDRLRGNTTYYKQVLLSFNPININHWIKKKFFDSDDLKSDTLIHHSTFAHNDFIDKEYGDSLKKRYKHNTNAYNVKVLGLWGNPVVGGEFYSTFNHEINTGFVRYNPEYPLILSFDFNTLPFSACLICQLIDKELRVIDEICLDHPNNRPLHVIKEFKRKYSHHKSGIWITGDASGKNESVRSDAGVNDYTAILNELKNYVGVKDFTPSKNHNVFQRGEFINALLAQELPFKVIINEDNEHLIEDLINVKRAEDGTKLKKRITDKTTGQSYEPFGHLSDAFDYAICTFLKDELRRYLKAGDDDIILSVGDRHVSSNLF
jgi:PBSX family phage terminase large subunit